MTYVAKSGKVKVIENAAIISFYENDLDKIGQITGSPIVEVQIPLVNYESLVGVLSDALSSNNSSSPS